MDIIRSQNINFFDKSSNEWDFVKYEGHNKINGFSYYGFYYLDESKIVVISYSTHGKYQNEDEIKHEGITLDLKKVLVEKFDLNQLHFTRKLHSNK